MPYNGVTLKPNDEMGPRPTYIVLSLCIVLLSQIKTISTGILHFQKSSDINGHYTTGFNKDKIKINYDG